MGHKQSTTEYLNFFDNLGDYSNTYKREYWTPENKSNSYARLKSTRPSNINPKKEINKGFIRLENISVSYQGAPISLHGNRWLKRSVYTELSGMWLSGPLTKSGIIGTRKQRDFSPEHLLSVQV